MVNEVATETNARHSHGKPCQDESRHAVPSLTVFFCPCCGTPSNDFTVTLHHLGFSFSMMCPVCAFPVEALICTPLAVQPTLGLA